MAKCRCPECEMLNDTIVYEEYSLGGSPFSQTYLRAYEGWKWLYNGSESVNMKDLPKRGCRLR